jgi:hypothetical protein
VSDNFSSLGECYDELGNFERMKSTEETECELAWVEAYTHHATAYEDETRQILRKRHLPASQHEIEDYKQHGWTRLYKDIHMIPWQGDGTILNTLLNFVENKARADQRRLKKNRTDTFSNIDKITPPTQPASDEVIATRLGLDNAFPAAEERFLDFTSIGLIRNALAASFEAKWFTGAQLCVLWIFSNWKPAQIALHLRQTDIRNDLAKAKRLFVTDFRFRLQALSSEYPDDAHFYRLSGLLEAYVNSNKDGDLNQNHPFIDHLRQFIVPQDLDPFQADWFPQFITSLKSSRIDDF